jgi:hypothetical protein
MLRHPVRLHLLDYRQRSVDLVMRTAYCVDGRKDLERRFKTGDADHARPDNRARRSRQTEDICKLMLRQKKRLLNPAIDKYKIRYARLAKCAGDRCITNQRHATFKSLANRGNSAAASAAIPLIASSALRCFRLAVLPPLNREPLMNRAGRGRTGPG